MSRRPFAWSYSRWSRYHKCPAQYNYNVNLKLPEEKKYASERGTLIHAKCEEYVKGNIPVPTKEMKYFFDDFKVLRKSEGVLTEVDLSVTAGWGPSHSKDWDHVWCRSKLDAVVPPQMGLTLGVDYKTGKFYESHHDQNKLYGTKLLVRYPEAKIAITEMWYLDTGHFIEDTWKRKDLPALKKYWEGEAMKMANDKKFKPSPGPHCRWCSYAKSKGGPCDEG